MPFVSKKQLRWMYAKKPRMAKRWAKHTPGRLSDLPERALKRSPERRSI